MPWNPLSYLPKEHQRLLWVALACSLAYTQGPSFYRHVRGMPFFTAWTWFVPDFFQEYASARNHSLGVPIYTEHAVSMVRELGIEARPGLILVEVNAHPPTSVLMALPLAGLSFEQAFFAWNLASLVSLAISLAIIWRQTGLPFSGWSLFPATALLLLCNPLWQIMLQGQFGLFLITLLAGTWAAERTGRPWTAGVLLGAATAIKLFPAFMIGYYAWRRQWRIVLAGIASIAALTVLTTAVLGPGAYRQYLGAVLPKIGWFRVGWNNASILGFWSKLFDPAPEKFRIGYSITEPWHYSPALARACYLISSILVVAVLGWAARGVRTREQSDRAFAVAVTAMLLVEPITWEHYFFLLLVTLAVTWLSLPRSILVRGLFLAIYVALCWNPVVLWKTFIPGGPGGAARPIDVIGTLSYQFYALLALFGLGIGLLRGAVASGDIPQPRHPEGYKSATDPARRKPPAHGPEPA